MPRYLNDVLISYSKKEWEELMATEKGVKHDANKLRLELIPTEVERAIGEVLSFGARKYTDNGWQSVSNSRERYYGACRRHMLYHRSGVDIDKESGLPHLWHALTNMAFLVYLREHPEEGV